jgi:drug/metabolite transporter (DMT)-like permease
LISLEACNHLGNLTLSSFGLICIAISLGAFGQVFIKRGLGAHGIAPGHGLLQTIMHIATAMLTPYVFGGLALYVFSTFFWLTAISRVRLSVAYPLISLSYPLVVVLSATMLGEQVQWLYAIAGLAFISAGVSFIGLGLGRGTEAES